MVLSTSIYHKSRCSPTAINQLRSPTSFCANSFFGGRHPTVLPHIPAFHRCYHFGHLLYGQLRTTQEHPLPFFRPGLSETPSAQAGWVFFICICFLGVWDGVDPKKIFPWSLVPLLLHVFYDELQGRYDSAAPWAETHLRRRRWPGAAVVSLGSPAMVQLELILAKGYIYIWQYITYMYIYIMYLQLIHKNSNRNIHRNTIQTLNSKGPQSYKSIKLVYKPMRL